jgi:hypothetical protein
VVLRHIVLSAALVAGLGGCKLSLFADHGENGDDVADAPGGGDADGMVQMMCGANCVGDAAGDFDGSTGGRNMLWQYLEDHRDRTWAPMTASGGGFVGADPANKITQGSGVLLVSTAGNSNASDPAIAFKSIATQNVKVTISVDFPAGASMHTVRLYRNSREDLLFSGVGSSGGSVSTSITVDGFNGDRFLLALSPSGAGATDIAVKIFVNGTGMSFPRECQVGMQFESMITNGIPNVCGQGVRYFIDDTMSAGGTATTPEVTTGPFLELGMAGKISFSHFFWGDTAVDRSGDSTTQFWFKHVAFDTNGDDYCIYSDQNCDTAAGGGLNIYRYSSGGQIGIQTCTGVSTIDPRDGTYNNETQWHFIRVVHAQGKVNLCIDGTKAITLPVAAGKLATPREWEIGKNLDYSPVGSFMSAEIDDVRILTTALPCE